MTSETRYFRSDEWTVNGLLAEKLTTAQSASAQTFMTSGGGDQTCYWGIRVWKRNAAGTETEITAGTPVAQISGDYNGGEADGTWACPEIVLVVTDAIVVRVYVKVGGGTWDLAEDWITEQLTATKLDAATWTVHYFSDKFYIGDPDYTTYGYFYWGSAAKNSRITNFTWSSGILKAIADNLTLTDAVSKVVTKFKAIADDLGITDAVSKVVTKFKVISDSLGLTDAVSLLKTILKAIADTLHIYDRGGHFTTAPSFGEYTLPHVLTVDYGDESLFNEKAIPDTEIAHRETFGARGVNIHVTGWAEQSDLANIRNLAHQTRIFYDMYGKMTECLMLKPEITESTSTPDQYDYMLPLMALDKEFPLSNTGDPSSNVSFGYFGFPHVLTTIISDASLSVDRSIPGAQVGYRKQIGATGRRAMVSGWMENDWREQMESLADNVIRLFTKGPDVSFYAKALKPTFRYATATPDQIDYDITILEVEAP